MNKPCNIQNTNICNGIFHISFVKALLINEGEATWGERESCRTGIGRGEATRRVNGIRSETTRYHQYHKKPGNEESLRKWFSALLESCLLLSREIGEPWNDERLCGWLAKSRQSASHAYCRVCNCDFKVEHSARLNDVTKHSVTESTELNPGCQQPFLFNKMSSAAKTSLPRNSLPRNSLQRRL